MLTCTLFLYQDCKFVITHWRFVVAQIQRSIANRKAQNARMIVIGAAIKFSKETPEARFPNVLRSRKTKINHTPMLITPDNLPAWI